MNREQSTSKRGFLILEILIATGIFLVLAIFGLRAIYYGVSVSQQSNEANQALYLAQEGIEAVKSIRDKKFKRLTVGIYGLQPTSRGWALSGSSDTTDAFFKREIIITTIDSFRKAVEVRISWPVDNPDYQLSLKTRFVKWKKRLASWTNPSIKGSFDLTAANSGSENQQSQAAGSGSLYIGNQNSAGKEFIILDDASIPDEYADDDEINPYLSLESGLDLSGSPNDLTVAQNGRIYIASTYDGGELQVVNADDPLAPFLSDTFDFTAANSGHDTKNALAIDTSGNIAVLSRESNPPEGEEFFVFDITAVPAVLLGKTNVDFNINDLEISGNYVFAATDDKIGEFKVFDISTPTAPTLVTSLNLNGINSPALSLAEDGNKGEVYVGRKTIIDPFLNALEVIDVASPSVPRVKGGYNVGADEISSIIAGTEADEDLPLVFTVSSASSNFRVFNVANGDLPTLVSALPLGGIPKKVIFSPEDINSLIVISSSNPEVRIISPEFSGLEE